MGARHAPADAVGARLREAREYFGFSEEEVARYLGLSQAAMFRTETGARQAGASELRSLAKLYQTSVELLVGCEQEAPGWESFPDLDQAATDLSTADRSEILRFAQFLCSRSADG